MNVQLLVVAKAPVPGRVKTRLAADVGADMAAHLAADALLDTLAVGRAAFERRHLAVAGDLSQGVRREELADAVADYRVFHQVGDDFAARLAAAHAAIDGPVVQIGMDTPHMSVRQLQAVAAGLERADAVLAPATDGGWWALALRDPAAAACLAPVPMSRPDTCDLTESALRESGLRVLLGDMLSDVDTAADASRVAAAWPALRFSHRWRDMAGAAL